MLSTGRNHLRTSTKRANREALKQSRYMSEDNTDDVHGSADNIPEDYNKTANDVIKALDTLISDVPESEVAASSSNSTSNACNSKIHYSVLYGRIDKDSKHDGSNIFVKKVLDSHKEACDYVHNFIKDYIVTRSGINFYNKIAFSCNIPKDFDGPHIVDGIYVLKNNNSWSVYRIATKLIKGYLGNYAEKDVIHLFNVYIAKEGYGYQLLDSDKPNYGDIMQELKIKINSLD